MFVSHFENKIQQANQIKSQGNQEFKAQKYSQAKNIYTKALQLVQPFAFHSATDLQKGKVLELRASLFFNIGLCSFNLKYWRDAQAKFTQALAINPNYMKAFCKRALAKYQLGQLEEAIKDISKALDLDHQQQNKEIKDAFDKIMKGYQQSQRARQRQNGQNNKPQEIKKEQIKQQVVQKINEKASEPRNYFAWKLVGVASLIGLGLYLINKNQSK